MPVNARNTGAELKGSQVNFTRPELSPCLAGLTDHNNPKYKEALSIVQAGRQTLQANPRADMPGFVASNEAIETQERLVTVSETTTAVRNVVRALGQETED